MNDQLQASLAVILQKATTGLEAGVNFLGAQIPDVVRQVLLFNLWKDVASVVIAVLILVGYAVGLAFLWKWAIKNEKENRWSDAFFGAGMLTTVTAIFAGFVVVWLISSFLDGLEIWLAPKVWLIEYASTFVKH